MTRLELVRDFPSSLIHRQIRIHSLQKFSSQNMLAYKRDSVDGVTIEIFRQIQSL